MSDESSTPTAELQAETTAEHTPEPWRVGEAQRLFVTAYRYLGGGEGESLDVADCCVGDGIPVAEAEANAARIVACVNACEGINPEAVPDLLAACEAVKTWCATCGVISPDVPEDVAAWDAVVAAIAKAKGGAA